MPDSARDDSSQRGPEYPEHSCDCRRIPLSSRRRSRKELDRNCNKESNGTLHGFQDLSRKGPGKHREIFAQEYKSEFLCRTKFHWCRKKSETFPANCRSMAAKNPPIFLIGVNLQKRIGRKLNLVHLGDHVPFPHRIVTHCIECPQDSHNLHFCPGIVFGRP